MYGIPWECQLPEELENVAAAGRCISATHEAAGSFRVMPTCMGLGEAAGTAAALAYAAGTALHEICGEDIRAAINEARKATGAPALDDCFSFTPASGVSERSVSV